MSEADRESRYDQVREQFVADPEFRSALRADPAGTLEQALGGLTDDERQWVSEVPDASVSDDELVERVRSGGLGAW